jgi:ribosomal protein S18 acetylase RimI-like enzyme
MVERGTGMVMSIAVSPQLRRSGIGDALMRSALNHLAGCERIWLLVDRKNVAAISLYHKHFFRETGRIIKGYYPNGDDAVEMLRTYFMTRQARTPANVDPTVENRPASLLR